MNKHKRRKRTRANRHKKEIGSYKFYLQQVFLRLQFVLVIIIIKM